MKLKQGNFMNKFKNKACNLTDFKVFLLQDFTVMLKCTMMDVDIFKTYTIV